MATITAFMRASNAKNDREANVRFRLTDGRSVQLFYVSELKIVPRLWSNQTQTIKAKVSYDEAERLVFNRKVEELKNKILDWYVSLDDKSLATTEALVEYMNVAPGQNKKAKGSESFEEIFERFLDERPISDVRKRQLRVVKNIVLRYERYMSVVQGKRYIFDYYNATQDTMRSIERFITDEHKIAEIYPELYPKSKSKCQIEKRGRNTVIGKLVYLRTFFNWAYPRGFCKNEPFKDYHLDPAVYGTPYYITTAELNHLENFPIKTPGLAKQRDIFVFQCCIGCRYSDLAVLKGSNVSNGAVEYIARKTREGNPVTVRVPMNNLAKKIYERYKPTNPNDKLLPIATDQVYNRAIKKMFKQAGLDRWVQILDPKTREPRQERLCDVATSHMARRTFIGNIYKKVRDQNLVSNMTGHRSGSAAFARYRTIEDDIRRDMVAYLDEKKSERRDQALAELIGINDPESEKRVQALKELLGINETELDRRVQALKEQLENSMA